jgi:hypothetical protein
VKLPFETLPPPDAYRWLRRRYVAGASLVAVGTLVWLALIPEDPRCSEPPCSDDVPFLFGLGLELTLLMIYLLMAAGVAIRARRERRR